MKHASWIAFTLRMYVTYLVTIFVFVVGAVASAAIYAYPHQALTLLIGMAVGFCVASMPIMLRRQLRRIRINSFSSLVRALLDLASVNGRLSAHRHTVVH